jgi:hypothetical protein
MIGAKGDLLGRYQANSSQLDQDYIKIWADTFPDWMPNRFASPTALPFPGLTIDGAFSRTTRSAGLLVFTLLQSGLASSALLSGLNAREDFEGFQGLIDWSVENRHMLPDLKEMSFDALRAKDRPLIATVVWDESWFRFLRIDGLQEYAAAAFFAWALKKDG